MAINQKTRLALTFTLLLLLVLAVPTALAHDPGDGGFEIYNVDDPTAAVKLVSFTIDELNPSREVMATTITTFFISKILSI